MRGLASVLLVLLLVGPTGCTGPSASPAETDGDGGIPTAPLPLPTEPGALSVATEALPVAAVGVPYAVSLEARGGSPPLSWSLEGALPPAIAFDDEKARLSGTAGAEGTFPLTVRVADAEGASAETSLDLVVAAPCAVTYEGRLERGAGVPAGATSLEAREGVAWRQVPLPPAGTSALVLAGTGAVDWYLADPGVPARSPYLARHFVKVRPGHELAPWVLDAYREAGDALGLWIVAREETPWSLQTRCTVGPYLVEDAFPATEKRRPLQEQFQVYAPGGSTAEVSVSLEGKLPKWLSWNEDTRELTGKTGRAVFYPFDLVLEDGKRKRRVSTGFGVWEPLSLPCGDVPVRITSSQGTDPSGRLPEGLDSRAFKIRLTVVGRSEAAVTVDVLDIDTPTFEAGFVMPGASPSSLQVVGAQPQGEDRRYRIDTRTWPSLREARTLGRGGLYTAIWDPEGPFDVFMVAKCEYGPPRVDWGAMPVPEPGVEQTWQLPVAGGVPNFTLAAEDLPDGLTLTSDGALTYSGGELPDEPVEVTFAIADAQKAEGTDTYTLYPSPEAACDGRDLLGCGAKVAPVLSADGEHAACLEPDLAEAGATVRLRVPNGALARLSSPVSAWRAEPVKIPVGDAVELAVAEDLLPPPETRGIGAPVQVEITHGDPGAKLDLVVTCDS